jgi:Domain of unknown function (DUF4412)
MKIFIIRSTLSYLLLTLAQSVPLQAQFFKDIINTVKQTAQGRANSKTSQTTNNAVDKVDGTTQVKTNNSTPNNDPFDSSATNSVLGAFAKAAAANPNDTSSADLTMKALGLLTGGGGVSPQDSMAAINNYKTASGGNGIHYEYSITISGKKIATTKDSSHIYFTNIGEGRAEMRIPMPGVQMNRMISIGRFNLPKYAIMLYPDSRTYSLNIIDTSLLKSRQTYHVTGIGTETVQGYSCIHSKLVSTSGSGLFKSTSTTDIWTCSSVPGYSLFKKMSSLQTTQTGMISALENAGCGGIFVKFVVSGKNASVEEVLIKAEESKFSEDLFRIPSGYTESKDNMFSHMLPPAKK